MREIEKVGVIGAGLMGHALAIVHALGGCNVIMQDLKRVADCKRTTINRQCP